MKNKESPSEARSIRLSSRPANAGGSSANHPHTRSADRLLVVGCGNPYSADDCVGLDIVHRLQARGDRSCEFLELPGGPLGLLDYFDKAEIILFVDAVQSGAPAGTVHLLPLPSREVVSRSMGRVSSHGWGLEETLRLAHSLGRRVPRLILLGVELASVGAGSVLTPVVDAAAESIVACFPELAAALRPGESPLWEGHHLYSHLAPGFTQGSVAA